MQVHLEYLEAGADILVSSSYQVCNANGLSFLYSFFHCIRESFLYIALCDRFGVPYF